MYDLSGGTPTLPLATLNNPDFLTPFGSSMAISGTRVIIGVALDDTGATDAGSVYVYDLSSATPTVPVAKINNPSPAASDHFGQSVAIFGTRVVVGTTGDDTGASNAGSTYVYDLNSGTPTVPMFILNNPAPATSDLFGRSVAVSDTRVVVGTPFDSAGATNAGSVYVYDMSSGTPTVPVATLNNPAPATSDWFGWSVAMDGTTVAIGTPSDDAFYPDRGSAYIYGSAAAEIAVEQPVGTGLIDNASIIAFTAPVGTSSPASIFTVRNTGGATLSGLAVSVDGTDSADFTAGAPGSTELAPGAATTFTVTFTPSGAGGGPRNAMLRITSNDTDESPFDITLTGTALTLTQDTDGDGISDADEFNLASLGFDWELAQPALKDSLFDNAASIGLYSTTQVQTLRIASPPIHQDPGTGAFTLTIGVEKSTNLTGAFLPFPMAAPQTAINPEGRLEFQFTPPDNAAFFLLKSQ
ncbi:MAG: choice-of-anchor D domain-containing protein [Verrucomicrobiae bacterium]|nr:choice-of-anchor D domain-containing protein [Verrucomicrobiae bacterium]